MRNRDLRAARQQAEKWKWDTSEPFEQLAPEPEQDEDQCPACRGTKVIQVSDGSGLVDQFMCDLCDDDQQVDEQEE